MRTTVSNEAARPSLSTTTSPATNQISDQQDASSSSELFSCRSVRPGPGPRLEKTSFSSLPEDIVERVRILVLKEPAGLRSWVMLACCDKNQWASAWKAPSAKMVVSSLDSRREYALSCAKYSVQLYRTSLPMGSRSKPFIDNVVLTLHSHSLAYDVAQSEVLRNSPVGHSLASNFHGQSLGSTSHNLPELCRALEIDRHVFDEIYIDFMQRSKAYGKALEENLPYVFNERSVHEMIRAVGLTALNLAGFALGVDALTTINRLLGPARSEAHLPINKLFEPSFLYPVMFLCNLPAIEKICEPISAVFQAYRTRRKQEDEDCLAVNRAEKKISGLTTFQGASGYLDRLRLDALGSAA